MKIPTEFFHRRVASLAHTQRDKKRDSRGIFA